MDAKHKKTFACRGRLKLGNKVAQVFETIGPILALTPLNLP